MFDPNQAYIEQLFGEYLQDPDSVGDEWKKYFESHFSLTNELMTLKFEKQAEKIEIKEIEAAKSSEYKLQKGERTQPLNSLQIKIAENMQESLEVPTASSARTIPVKALDENRRIINKYLTKLKKNKVSFTHILSWAVSKALLKFPQMNFSYGIIDAKPQRIVKSGINLGFAVDITKKDGSRMLLVPNIKNVQDLQFAEYIAKYDDLIKRAKTNKLNPEELQGTTATLTNPGMLGTTFSSPRLMKGQGLIVATGSIDYPQEFSAVRPDLLSELAVSKVVTLTNTYDHRIIQGAESAEFLAYIHKLLIGDFQFYDQIFASLHIPFETIRWQSDKPLNEKRLQSENEQMVEKNAHVMLLINAYRVRGHLLAYINPLGYSMFYYPELDPSHYGFTIWDLDRYFHCDDRWENNYLPLRDIIGILRDTYCGTISYEFMHIQDVDKKDYIKSTLEKATYNSILSKDEKIRMFKKLTEAEEFENFLHTKFIGHKRFSLEGGESLIVILAQIIEQAAENEMNSVYLGMPHRGRLNVLANIIGKSLEEIFDEFDGDIDLTDFYGSGDVKYHLGSYGVYSSINEKKIDVYLSPNPSHLELVDPVVEGMARAKANQINDFSYSKVLPVLVHGDAAFAGQGIVAETLNLSQLDGYKTGGTIHIIINNQIGFTTFASDSRSTIYATDIAKMIQSPIIHVNGNAPEAVAQAAIFAFNYRKKFHTDIVIDILCYRKYGHNEGDDPSYTQPLLYKKIKSLEPVGSIYKKELLNAELLTEAEAMEFINNTKQILNDVYSSRDKMIPPPLESRSQDIALFVTTDTKVSIENLVGISEKITTISDNFHINPKLKSLLNKRFEMVRGAIPKIDWSMAEALAFGSILMEGKDIRFSGQDSKRGTFSQRHICLTDMETEDIYIPLNHIAQSQGTLRIYDSPLSEVSVLGFEYGYSVVERNGLTVWESQFGDFANNAQSVFDQFIACSEIKWGQTSNLMLLLPHSYDGQGPEHSSGRIERYLQLCAENNIYVCNLTTPAQYFHVIRRQVTSKIKKPLIIFTPKSMLRNPQAVSSIEDLSNRNFMEIIDDTEIKDKSKVKTLNLCSGKIYWELEHLRKENGIENVAIVRIEQLYPFHSELMKQIAAGYPNCRQINFVQEEPKNMGGWSFISQLVRELLPNFPLQFIGRKPSPATATGFAKIHAKEQQEILNTALGIR